MMKQFNLSLCFAAIFFLLSQFLGAQNGLYTIRQVAGSEPELAGILSPYLEPGDSVVALAYFFPNSCPRCEGLINFILEHKKNLGINAKLIGVLDYPKSQAGKKYYALNNWALDAALVDTAAYFGSLFKYTDDRLRVPFIMLVNAHNGRLLKATSLLGIECNEDFVRDFFQAPSTPLEQSPVASRVPRQQAATLQRETGLAGDIVALENNPETPYSAIYDIITSDGKTAFIDQLFNDVFVFDENGVLLNTLKPTESEYRAFVSENINDEFYGIIRPILRCIYLKLLRISQDTAFISASLPKASLDTNTFSLEYYNEPVVLMKNWKDNTFIGARPIHELPYELEAGGYVIKHSNLQAGHDYCFMPAVRGWPSVGTENTPPDIPEKNPFDENFYTHTFIGALYSPQGEFIQTLGELPAIWKELKAGYYLSNYCYAESEDNIVAADKFLGVAYIYHKPGRKGQALAAGPIGSITLFETPFEAEKERLKAACSAYQGIGGSDNDSLQVKDYFIKELKGLVNQELLSIQLFGNELLAAVIKEDKKQRARIEVFGLDSGKSLFSKVIPLTDEALGAVRPIKVSYDEASRTARVMLAYDEGEKILLRYETFTISIR